MYIMVYDRIINQAHLTLGLHQGYFTMHIVVSRARDEPTAARGGVSNGSTKRIPVTTLRHPRRCTTRIRVVNITFQCLNIAVPKRSP